MPENKIAQPEAVSAPVPAETVNPALLSGVAAFNPAEIVVDARLRHTLNHAALTDLQESIKTHGLLHPPIVRRVIQEDHEEPHLVAGWHRLEAARRLGLQTIDCFVFTGTEHEAREVEIDENLCRADLNKSERREHIAAKAQRLTEKTVATVSQNGPPAGGVQPGEKGIRKVARELGIPRSTASRQAAAAALAPAAKQAADEGGLGTTIRATIAKLPEAEQEAATRDALRVKREQEEARRATAKANAPAARGKGNKSKSAPAKVNDSWDDEPCGVEVAPPTAQVVQLPAREPKRTKAGETIDTVAGVLVEYVGDETLAAFVKAAKLPGFGALLETAIKEARDAKRSEETA